MEDCSCCSRKARPTIVAIPTVGNFVLVLASNFFTTTVDTTHAVLPTFFFYKSETSFLVWKLFHKIQNVHSKLQWEE